MIMTNISGDVN